jgi:hypothetical protein
MWDQSFLETPLTPATGGRIQAVGLVDHTLVEVAKEMGAMDHAEDSPVMDLAQDNEEVVWHVPSESSVSDCVSVVCIRALKKNLASHHHRPWQRPNAMRVSSPAHCHRESKTMWAG